MKFNCEHISELTKSMPKEDYCIELSDFFSVFSDSSRLRILFTMQKKEICVHDISLLLGMSQSAVSHQLRTLRQRRIVKVVKKGKNSFYSLADNHIIILLKQAGEHIGGECDAI